MTGRMSYKRDSENTETLRIGFRFDPYRLQLAALSVRIIQKVKVATRRTRFGAIVEK